MPGALYLSQIATVGRRGTVFPHDRGFTSDYFFTTEPKLSFSVGDTNAMLLIFGSYRDRRTNGLNVYTKDLFEYETLILKNLDF